MKHSIDRKFPFEITAYLGADGQPVVEVDTGHDQDRKGAFDHFHDSRTQPYLRVYVNDTRVSQYAGREPWRHEALNLEVETIPADTKLTVRGAEKVILDLYRLIESSPEDPGWHQRFFALRERVADRHTVALRGQSLPPGSSLTLERADRLIRDLWSFLARPDVESTHEAMNEEFFNLRQRVRCRHDDPRECPTMAALAGAATRLERAR